MNIFVKTDTVLNRSFTNTEAIYDLLSGEQGRSEIHSVVIATIAFGKSSLMHYHRIAEESTTTTPENEGFKHVSVHKLF